MGKATERAAASGIIDLVSRLFPAITHSRWGWADEMLEQFDRDVGKLGLEFEQIRACLTRLASEQPTYKGTIKPATMLKRLRELTDRPKAKGGAGAVQHLTAEEIRQSQAEFDRIKSILYSAAPEAREAAKARATASMPELSRYLPSPTLQFILLSRAVEELQKPGTHQPVNEGVVPLLVEFGR